MSKLCSEAQGLIDRDMKMSENYAQSLVSEPIHQYTRTNNCMKYILTSLTVGTSVTTKLTHNSLRILSAASKVMGFGLAVLSVALDTVEVIRTSKEINEGSRSALADKIQTVITQLEANKQDFIKTLSHDGIL